MKNNDEFSRKQSRRDFLKGSGVGLLGAGAAMALGTEKVFAAPPKGVPTGPIKLGCFAFMSGTGGPAGMQGLQGAQVWGEQINKEGGILGRKVEVKIEEETGAKECVEKFKKFILKDKCDAVFGLNSTGNSQAVAKEAEALKELYLAWDGTTQDGLIETMPNPKYTFRSVDNELEAVAGAILTVRYFPNIKKVTGINNDYSYGRNCYEAYTKVLKMYKPDITVMDGIFTKLGETDFTAVVDAFKARQPDIIQCSFFHAENTIFFKQAHAKELFKNTKACFHTACYVGDTLKKEFVPEGHIIGYNSFYPHYTDNWPLLNEFWKLYVQKFKIIPGPVSDHAFFTLQAYKTAIEKCYTLLGRWPKKEEIAETLKGISVPSLSGYRSYRHDNKMDCNFFLGLTTHKNSFDYVTINPVFVFPGSMIQKPVGYSFDQWLDEWKKSVKI